MNLLLVFITNLVGYTMLYASYSYAAKTAVGRVIWVAASVIGMLVGSTIGEKLFRS